MGENKSEIQNDSIVEPFQINADEDDLFIDNLNNNADKEETRRKVTERVDPVEGNIPIIQVESFQSIEDTGLPQHTESRSRPVKKAIRRTNKSVTTVDTSPT